MEKPFTGSKMLPPLVCSLSWEKPSTTLLLFLPTITITPISLVHTHLLCILITNHHHSFSLQRLPKTLAYLSSQSNQMDLWGVGHPHAQFQEAWKSSMLQQNLQNHQVLCSNLDFIHKISHSFWTETRSLSSCWFSLTSPGVFCDVYLWSWLWVNSCSCLSLEGLAEEDWKIKRQVLLQKKVPCLPLSLTRARAHTERERERTKN